MTRHMGSSGKGSNTATLKAAANALARATKVQERIEADCRQLAEENEQLRSELRLRHDLSGIVGTSKVLWQLRDRTRIAAGTDTVVLLSGEPGTGKELAARTIHANSNRSSKAFVKVNCAMVSDGMLESYFPGPTDAIGHRDRNMSRVPGATGGVLFLAEVDRLTDRAQRKLFTLLRQVDLGRQDARRTIADVRVMVATTSNMEAAVADGTFREDLYHELNAFQIFIPPLRDRKGDVSVLAHYFLEKSARDQGRGEVRLSESALDALTSYPWPGNVAELEEAVDQAVLKCAGTVVYVHHLPSTLRMTSFAGNAGVPLAAAVEGYEKELILDALKAARGNRARAARLLETTERIVNYKIKKLAIDYRRFKPSRNRGSVGDPRRTGRIRRRNDAKDLTLVMA